MQGRIIITGGTGFIGRHLSALLVQSGYEVIVLTRSDPPPGRPHLVRWDGKTSTGWLGYAEGAHAIVNLAGENIGEGIWTAARKRRIMESRVNAGAAVMEAFSRCQVRPRVLVQASAVGFYGDRGDEQLGEGSAPGKGFLSEVTRRWEESTAGAPAMGVRRCVTRFGVVLGKGGIMGKMLLPFKMFAGGVPGDGKNWISWVHVADAAGAILHLIQNGRANGAFNVVSPSACTAHDFYHALGSVMRRPVWVPVPASLLRRALGEMAEELMLSGQHAVPEKLMRDGYAFMHPKLEEALRDVVRR